MTPKRLAIQFAIVNLIHCRRVRRRDLLAKGRPPYIDLSVTALQILKQSGFGNQNPVWISAPPIVAAAFHVS
ncbi:MAG: hypothetical protein LBK82_01530 [Planctomycetaceae bacterium]|nr:hypothetical protein [Planctomycetaceae bacterium]